MSKTRTGGAIWFAMTHSKEGGVLEAWRNLAQGFAGAGAPAELLAIYPDPKKPAAADIRFVCSNRPTGIMQYFQMLRRLVHLLRLETPAAIVTAMPLANLIFPLVAALSGAKSRVVVTHHSPLTSTNKLSRLLDGVVSATPSVNNIVCVSQAVYDTQPESGAYRRKSVVIQNALGPEVEARIHHLNQTGGAARSSSRLIVAAAGRLAPEKNYPLLIRAAARSPDIHVRIAGAGPDEAALRDLAASLGVADQVEFLGFRSRAEVLSMLADADMFVQPSFFEGHSLALIEAAKLGLPLIVSNVPGQIEGITEQDGTLCGQVVEVDDVERLAHEILALSDAQHRERLSRLSLKLGEQSSYASMLDKYRDVVGLGAS